MSRSKYINTFNTTAEYENYIESAYPEFPNVGYDKQAGNVKIRRQSPNDYQIWGTTTATSNFNIKLNNTNVEVTVVPELGEFYLQGWTGTLTNLSDCFSNKPNITSIKKFNIDCSNVTNIYNFLAGLNPNNSNVINIDMSGITTTKNISCIFMFQYCGSIPYIDLSNFAPSSNLTDCYGMFEGCSSLITLNLNNITLSSTSRQQDMFNGCSSLTDVYINVEATLMKLTNNLSSQYGSYIPSSATIHYNDVDYKWQNNRWTPQS